MRMEAIVAQAVDEAMVVSQSLARGGIDRAMRRCARPPSGGENLKALGLVRPLDDLDRPLARTGDGIAEFVARIAAIGKDMAQPGKRRRTALRTSTAPSRS
jgi:hypothetical protein